MRYVDCLEDLGGIVTVGRLEAVTGSSRVACGAPIQRFEEKESVVAIATSMLVPSETVTPHRATRPACRTKG